MATIKTYSPKDVQIAWFGFPLTGMAEDTFVTVRLNSDASETIVGAQGDVAPTKIANDTGMVEVTLLQNSESNIALSDIYLAQRASSDLFKGNMTITDPSGGMLFEVSDAHLMTFAECTLGSGQNAKTWTYFADRLTPIGTNSEITEALGAASRINALVKLATGSGV